MLKWIDKLLFREIVIEEENKPDLRSDLNKSLSKSISKISKVEGLNNMLENNIVQTYLLEVYCKDILSLINAEQHDNFNVELAISVGDYFNMNSIRIYQVLESIQENLELDRYNQKQLLDVKAVIDMFNFYLGEENVEWI